VNERYTGLCAHWNIQCALRQALERAVLAVQIERTPGPGEQSEWSQERARSIRALLKDIPVTARLRSSLTDENDYLQGWQKLAACLQDQGWQIAIVPLPEDETVSRLLPCALRLLALRQGSEGRS